MPDILAQIAGSAHPIPWWQSTIGLAVLLALAYVGSCVQWPYKHCRWCKGRSRHYRDDRRVFRDCRWCGGSGRKRRVGRWAWDRYRASRRDS